MPETRHHRRGNPRTLASGSPLPWGTTGRQTWGVAVVTLHAADRRARAVQWRSVYTLLLSALTCGLVAILTGEPYWAFHVPAAGLAFAMSATLAAAGTLLTLGEGSRTSGIMLICAAILSAVSWISAWNSWVLPAFGEVAQSLFFFFLGTGVLLAGRAKFESWFEWGWSVLAFLVLPVQQLVILAAASPEQLGYSSHATWPTARLSDRVVAAMLHVGAYLYIVLAVTFIGALIAQRLVGPSGSRRRSILLILCSGVFALGAALIQAPIMSDAVSLDRVLSARSGQMGAAVVIPLALFASALAERWRELTLAARIQSLLGGIVTPVTVEGALREVLADPELKVWLWVPARNCYVDIDGRIRAGEEHIPGERTLHVVQTPKGETLAICDVDAALAEGGNLLNAAMQACASAFIAIQLQMETLEQVRAVQGRLMEVELETRRELARNIHDGVQQDLAALNIEISRLRNRCSSDELRSQATECSARLNDITQEVRRIGRGLHPQALLERGLAGALEDDAERLGRTVAIDIGPRRLPPRIEVALYYMLAEALNNVQKHAAAEKVSVSVEKADDTVVADVIDNGKGGAALTFGGGLHGIDDRARALRGALEIQSVPMQGTHLRISIPLNESV